VDAALNVVLRENSHSLADVEDLAALEASLNTIGTVHDRRIVTGAARPNSGYSCAPLVFRSTRTSTSSPSWCSSGKHR